MYMGFDTKGDMEMECIQLNVGKGYGIVSSLDLDEIIGHILSLIKKNRIFIITDDTVSDLYCSDFAQKIEKYGITPIIISLPHGEYSKSNCGLQKIYSHLILHCADRSDMIINFGGGMVGDLGGFAAATYMRGINFINMPTTLLSMIDSSIGGKTAINFYDEETGNSVKNVIGAFHQPIGVCIYPPFLRTLPESELKSGMGEIVKYAVIDGMDGSENELFRPNSKLIMHCCRIKKYYVESDQFDFGDRKKLNLGHTYGHAFEAASGFTLSHGEAVGLGLVAICDLGIKLGITTPLIKEKIISLLNTAGLETDYGKYTANAARFITHDKKAIGKNIDMIMIRSIGDVIVHSVPIETVKELLKNE